MPEKRNEVVSAIVRARADLDRVLARLETLAADDKERVSYAAHALNNYLMVVSTTLEQLRKKLTPKGDRDIRRLLDSLNHATNLMMSTARGVLIAVPHELPHLLFEPASLTEIAEQVCRGYRDLARTKGVRVSWRAASKPDRVVTDRVAVGAVLDNLLSNAVKYSRAGTLVSVSTVILSHQVTCSVEDRGPGISETDQANLFQRGVRLSAIPTAGESSSGYGLAIANDLTKALGGQLLCSSILGQGTRFSFSLKLVAMDGETPAQ